MAELRESKLDCTVRLELYCSKDSPAVELPGYAHLMEHDYSPEITFWHAVIMFDSAQMEEAMIHLGSPWAWQILVRIAFADGRKGIGVGRSTTQIWAEDGDHGQMVVSGTSNLDKQ